MVLPMDGETFTIGALAQHAEVNVETVRYYERIGLLPKPARTGRGHRRYTGEDLARLRFVRHATGLGFTLTETKDLLALRARSGAPCGAVRARAERKLETIERKLSELRALRDAVARLVSACAGDTAVERCSILAALEAPATPKRKKKNHA
jgi:MerR family copper efflux transcriptional regulator